MPARGIEPPTNRLRVECSTVELRGQTDRLYNYLATDDYPTDSVDNTNICGSYRQAILVQIYLSTKLWLPLGLWGKGCNLIEMCYTAYYSEVSSCQEGLSLALRGCLIPVLSALSVHDSSRRRCENDGNQTPSK
jgi:hypothetical protein